MLSFFHSVYTSPYCIDEIKRETLSTDAIAMMLVNIRLFIGCDLCDIFCESKLVFLIWFFSALCYKFSALLYCFHFVYFQMWLNSLFACMFWWISTRLLPVVHLSASELHTAAVLFIQPYQLSGTIFQLQSLKQTVCLHSVVDSRHICLLLFSKTVVNFNVASASVALCTFSLMALYKFVFNFNLT